MPARRATATPAPSNLNQAFLESVRVDQRPAALLCRYFLEAVEQAESMGVRSTVAPVERLVRTNADNRAGWRKILPLFDPAYNALDENNSFCLLAETRDGEVIASATTARFSRGISPRPSTGHRSREGAGIWLANPPHIP